MVFLFFWREYKAIVGGAGIWGFEIIDGDGDTKGEKRTENVLGQKIGGYHHCPCCEQTKKKIDVSILYEWSYQLSANLGLSAGSGKLKLHIWIHSKFPVQIASNLDR